MLTHRQSAGTLPSVLPPSTTLMSALSACSSKRARVVPRRTALRSVCHTTRLLVSMPNLTQLLTCTVFHLAHCATACAAPKLWAKLK